MSLTAMFLRVFCFIPSEFLRGRWCLSHLKSVELLNSVKAKTTFSQLLTGASEKTHHHRLILLKWRPPSIRRQRGSSALKRMPISCSLSKSTEQAIGNRLPPIWRLEPAGNAVNDGGTTSPQTSKRRSGHQRTIYSSFKQLKMSGRNGQKCHRTFQTDQVSHSKIDTASW